VIENGIGAKSPLQIRNEWKSIVPSLRQSRTFAPYLPNALHSLPLSINRFLFPAAILGVALFFILQQNEYLVWIVKGHKKTSRRKDGM
jgi:hypothetical protein